MNTYIVGVRLPYRALINRLTWQWKELPYKHNEDFCIFKTALTFVDSVCEIWGPLIRGLTLVVVPRNVTKNPEKFIHILNQYKVGLNDTNRNNLQLHFNVNIFVSIC